MPTLTLEDGRVLDLREWVTVTAYCKLHNKKVSTVSSWIDRQKLPPHKVVVVAELNSLKLLRNEQYKV